MENKTGVNIIQYKTIFENRRIQCVSYLQLVKYLVSSNSPHSFRTNISYISKYNIVSNRNLEIE